MQDLNVAFLCTSRLKKWFGTTILYNSPLIRHIIVAFVSLTLNASAFEQKNK